MPSPRKDSDASEHAMDEAKLPKVEIKSSATDSTVKTGTDSTAKHSTDNTAENGKLASSLTVLNEVIDVAVVKAEQVKSLEDTAAEVVFASFSRAKETTSSQSEIPPAVDSDIDSSKAIAIQEMSKMVPIIKVTYTSPDKIKEKPEQATGVSKISEKVERKIEIKQNVEKLPQKPVCEEPGKTHVPKKVQLKSSGDATVKEVKLSSETKTQKSSESTKFDTNIDLSKTESVPEKTAPNVPVPDGSTGKTKDESRVKIKCFRKDGKTFIAKKDQESEIQAIVEVENQMSEVPRFSTRLGEYNYFEYNAEPLIAMLEEENLMMYQNKKKADTYTHVTATKPVYSKASGDSLPYIDLKGLTQPTNQSYDGETKFSKCFDALPDWSAYGAYLHGDRKNLRLRIAKPDFPYVSTSLQQTVVVNQGKFKVSLDASQFDIENIHLSIKDGKIHVCARQANETEFGLEYHEIQQIFKIPNHVNRDEFTACITKDYRLLVEAPIKIPSSD